MGPDPTPAGFLLNMFKPMYAAAGIEDPWEFYAVQKVGKKDARILQSSRFGIGDVTFLCHAYGLFEYRVDTVSRFSANAIHMEKSGEKIAVEHVCKALGLLGDPRVDKLHGMTHRLGNMINGDYRRFITSDATGMDAQRFTTFSAGPGAYQITRMWYYLHTHPWEVAAAMKTDTWKMMPRHEMSPTQPDQPVYQTNVQYEMHAGNVFANCFGPEFFNGIYHDDGAYKYSLIHTMHPTETFLDYCKKDWDRYQDLIHDRNPGFKDVKRVEYPYSIEMINGWFKEYTEWLKIPVRPEGPTKADKEQSLAEYLQQDEAMLARSIPHLIRESRYLPNLKADEDAVALALANSIYKLKKDLTASKKESAMDFDDEQYDAWKDSVASDYTFASEEIDAYSKDLLKNMQSWGVIVGVLKGKQ